LYSAKRKRKTTKKQGAERNVRPAFLRFFEGALPMPDSCSSFSTYYRPRRAAAVSAFLTPLSREGGTVIF
jgi:hypothetical protein